MLVAKRVIETSVKSSKHSGVSFAVPFWLMLLVIAAASAIGAVSGNLPARRAARLDPPEALRYE